MKYILILAIALNLYANKLEIQLNDTDIGLSYQHTLKQDDNDYYIKADTLYIDENKTINTVSLGAESMLLNDYGFRFGLNVSLVDNGDISIPFGLDIIYEWGALSYTVIGGKYATKILSENKEDNYNSYTVTQYFALMNDGYIFARYRDEIALVGFSVGF